MRAFILWLAGLAATSVMVAIAFQWLDRPIALFAHSQAGRSHHGIWVGLTHIPDPLIPLAVIAFVVLGLRALLGKAMSRHRAAALVGSVSVIVAETTKDQLKFIFGRTWPETWTHNNPSFIHDGVYGFHFLHGGEAYDSFPSGHMTATCAVISVIWLWYPHLRWLCAIAALAVAAGLVGANYHFLSDVIGGAFVGMSVGWMTTAIWKAIAASGAESAT
jgi:membrane-associated phospholipid phosphatase